MTDEKLNEIEAKANAATPGPWHIPDMEDAGGFAITNEPCRDGLQTTPDVAYVSAGFNARPRADAAFIALAREAVPALVAEVRRLRAVEEAARRFVEWDVLHHETCAQNDCDGDCECGYGCLVGENCGCAKHECAGECPAADVAALRAALDAAKETP